jgi:predicted RNA-binding Zn-ribbon protein involved in translation (DUF1610 family)
MSNIKCPQCGLVNFAGAEKCKRCDADLSKIVEVVEQERVTRAVEARRPNLFPCPDCERMISRNAESCPNCGRFMQRLGAMTVDRRGWAGTIALGIFLIGVLYVLATVLIFTLLLGMGRR